MRIGLKRLRRPSATSPAPIWMVFDGANPDPRTDIYGIRASVVNIGKSPSPGFLFCVPIEPTL